ncbi:hemagglutinin, partial [Neisseria meningitidis]|nr:hemagglutinin [Neisseria meningitidis]
DVFGNHGLGGLLEEGAHGKSPKWLGGNLGDFGEFCKGLRLYLQQEQV